MGKQEWVERASGLQPRGASRSLGTGTAWLGAVEMRGGRDGGRAVSCGLLGTREPAPSQVGAAGSPERGGATGKCALGPVSARLCKCRSVDCLHPGCGRGHSLGKASLPAQSGHLGRPGQALGLEMSLVQCNLSRERGSPKQAWLGVVLALLGLRESFFSLSGPQFPHL